MKDPASRADVTVAGGCMPLVRLALTTPRFSSGPEGIGMSNIRKIVFLHEQQFSEKYYREFGIEILESRGFEVEVWNFSPFLQKSNYLIENPPCSFACKNHLTLESKFEAIQAIHGLTEDCFVIIGIHLNAKTLGLYRALAKRSLICASFLAIALPLGTLPKKLVWINRVQKLTWSTIAEKFIYRIPYALLGIKPVNIIFATAEKFFTYGYPYDETSEKLWVHNLDYDNFLAEHDKQCDVNSKQGVFLDEYLPYHPDFPSAGFHNIPADAYYERMVAFFDNLESQHDVKIVIAAHPKANYSDKPGVFGARTIIQHQTGRLVRESGFVILHQSMSLNHAVLHAKPMIFVVTEDVLSHLIEDPHPQWLANTFGKTLHNLDQGLDIDFETEMRVDEEAYRTYINNYIKKTGSPERPFWEIVADRISMIG